MEILSFIGVFAVALLIFFVGFAAGKKAGINACQKLVESIAKTFADISKELEAGDKHGREGNADAWKLIKKDNEKFGS